MQMIPVVVALFVGLLSYLVYVVLRFLRLVGPVDVTEQNTIPGPKPHWLLGNLPDMKKRGIFGFHHDNMLKYGSIYRVKFFRTQVTTNTAEAAKVSYAWPVIENDRGFGDDVTLRDCQRVFFE